MLNFNLLPPAYKEDYLFARKIKLVGHSLRICLGILSIFSLFLIFILGYLQHEEAKLLSSLNFLKKSPALVNFRHIQKEINDFNQELSLLTKVAPSTNWTGILIELARATQTVELTKIAIQKTQDQEQIVLEGRAQNRQALLAWEERLKALSYSSHVISPLSNYEKTSDITFQVSLTLKKQ